MTVSIGTRAPDADLTRADRTAEEEAPAAPGLPRPAGPRWQPLRLGLVDLFYYENEVFPFRDGRLLLRGNNGAGKSKVLALTLPFLLDGDMSARRVEPDADPGKRMEWNLLLGGEHPNSERLGYSWLEFGRVDEEGVEHFLTIGAGLKAARGRGVTRNWFFITSRRVGGDISLVDGNRLALGRERLAVELDERGRVYDTKAEYRRALDETLFGLGERRYAALVQLLLQLRAPQLSKRPDERLLSEALTESLTPVGEDVIKSVADGLRSLDEERDELQALSDVHRSVLGFLDHYRAYARILMKRQAEGPRMRQSEYDREGRSVIEVTAQTEALEAELGTVAATLHVLTDERTDRAGEREALRDSEFVEIEKQLGAADELASKAEERRRRAVDAHGSIAKTVTSAEERAETERVRVGEARAMYEAALAAARSAAENAGLGEDHGRALASLASQATTGHGRPGIDTNPPDHSPVVDPDAERLLAEDEAQTIGRIDQAREALARIRALLEALASAESELASAERTQASAETRLAEAMEARGTADEDVESAIDRYLADVEISLAGLSELVVPEDAVTSVAEWMRVRDGENPAVGALRRAGAERSSLLQERRAATVHDRAEREAHRDELAGEIARLESGETVRPPAVHTRTEAEGATPLWSAVSFRDDVDEHARAGVEAALEASGLLTAVVRDGSGAEHPESGEVLLVPHPQPAGVRTLGSLLRADVPSDAPVSVATIEAVLASIVLADGNADPGPVWASATGEFRLGSARGAWSKPAAVYVGETARAAARQRRLEHARVELEEVHERIRDLDAEIETIERRLAVVAGEVEALPHPDEVDAADRRAAVAASLCVAAAAERDAAAEVVVTAAGGRSRAAAELADDAAALGLPTDAGDIAARDAALAEYERLAGEFWRRADRFLSAVRTLADVEARLAADRARLADVEGELTEAAEDAAMRRSYADTLRANVGADVADYRARVAEVEESLKRLEAEITEATDTRIDLDKRHAVLVERLNGIRERQEEVAAARVDAVNRLRKTTALGFARAAALETAEPGTEEDWTVTRGVQFARAIEQELASVEASASRYDRSLSQVHTEFSALQRALGRHGHNAVSYPYDDGYQVLVMFAGREVELVELSGILAEQLEERERLLSAREREIIQNHLVTEVGAQLSELIGAADRQIAEINQELRIRPTSTGMMLRVQWRPRVDGPAGLAEARRILATTSDVWGERDRETLGGFLQSRIAEVREADESGTWYDHLGDALDYRRWHRFVVERQQAGSWKPASGPASGGERVLAATIPLFAAASSHYRTAGNPLAPRLVMLDEAFAGVDDGARAGCLGLLAAFDLDVVMTSEREWGCYAEVPALSIAQLTRYEDATAVHVQLWQWDGRRRSQVETDGGERGAVEGSLW